ncbi:MAG: hypothetical protein DIZ77_18800 [endosymbiont of Seepiophila jonesi]|uniref:Tetratricopeptide repeat protein n=1 Tax=endosymbiont of Lamellibrachia luymesi TaxID=2200907 RepID=A0A370E0T6_9GAMM|nr:MAG: hypothetical protein DIZ77_18800 [endosymbiont of Seepiophila jonesi]RDH91711.1 MAG: hypothetical protein DIZ79_05405 [endosymbiont of Lamellibrachia luymesi]
MKNQTFAAFAATSFLIITGCTGIPTTDPQTAITTPPKTPTLNPAASMDDSKSDIIYDILAAEVAAQRGQHDIAYEHASNAARTSRAPAAAERATRLALLSHQTDKALQSVNFWIEIDPESLKAHQIAAILYIRAKNRQASVLHLSKVAAIANQAGQSGYIQAAAIAEKSTSKDNALQLMQLVIPRDTSDPEALYALALSASHAKEHAVAEDYLRRALQTRPDWTKGLLLLSRSLMVQDRKDESIEVLAKAAIQSPKDIQLRITYARTLVDLHRLDDAHDEFSKLYKLEPDNADIVYALGVLSIQRKELKAARGFFQHLLSMGKMGSQSTLHLGQIEELDKHPQKAFEWYEKVDGKERAEARIRMAGILVSLDNLNGAREILQQLRSSTPTNALKLFLIEANLMRDAGEYKIAMEIYDTALQKFPDNIDLRYARALNGADIGRVDILEADLKRILKDNPDHADSLNALGYTLADQTDRLQEARAYIQRALDLKPGNVAILDSMGWVEYRLGNLEQALKFLQQAADKEPDAEIAAHLGEVLWMMGRKQEARAVWDAAMKRDPKNRYIGPTKQRLSGK